MFAFKFTLWQVDTDVSSWDEMLLAETREPKDTRVSQTSSLLTRDCLGTDLNVDPVSGNSWGFAS